jgi:thiamine kinase-like enzyme
MAIDALARLGPSPLDLTRKGSSTVLQGNGLVLKMGPPDRAAREAFVLGELDLPVETPTLVDSGDGWLLLRSIDNAEASDLALADLARLHDAFTGAPVLADDRLRDVTQRELPALLERVANFEPSEPLRRLIADPSPLLAELSGPRTLVHGDAWPGNIVGTCWIDWEEAGVGHPALDLANWLYGSPWVPASTDPERDLALYLNARAVRIDADAFARAVDAAVILLFILLDLPGIAGWDEKAGQEVVIRRAARARRLLGEGDEAG